MSDSTQRARAVRVFNVLTSGLSEREINVLQSVFALTRGRRECEYRLATVVEREQAHIALVDHSKSATLQQFNARRTPERRVPVVLVADDDSPLDGMRILRRPITLTKVMALFDQITIAHYQHSPELVIGDDQQADDAVSRALVGRPRAVARYAALVVDDSESVRRAMEIQLQLYGIKPSFAPDGASALRAAAAGRPDLIFLDITLPDLDGYEVCRRIRAMPAHRATPICIMTSKGSVLDKMKGTMSGCSLYLTKPVRSDRLRDALTRFLPAATARSDVRGS